MSFFEDCAKLSLVLISNSLYWIFSFSKTGHWKRSDVTGSSGNVTMWWIVECLTFDAAFSGRVISGDFFRMSTCRDDLFIVLMLVPLYFVTIAFDVSDFARSFSKSGNRKKICTRYGRRDVGDSLSLKFRLRVIMPYVDFLCGILYGVQHIESTCSFWADNRRI